MFCFTIRDVLWLTVVVAFAACWYLERDGRTGVVERANELIRENAKLKQEVHDAEIARRHAEFQSRLRARELVDGITK